MRREKPTAKLVALVLVGLAALTLTARADDWYEENRQRQERLERMWELERRGREDADYAAAASASADGNRYAAIAYSTATGRYGYAYGYDSLAQAQRVAMAHCGAADARPVTWAKNGWHCALAKGADGSYGWGYGPNAASAQAAALRECRKHSNDCRIVACVH